MGRRKMTGGCLVAVAVWLRGCVGKMLRRGGINKGANMSLCKRENVKSALMSLLGNRCKGRQVGIRVKKRK